MSVSKSVTRVFELFLLFREHKAPLNATEIRSGLKTPQSTLSDMLAKLRELGYLEYDAETRRYFPSGELHHLFSWLKSQPLISPQLKALVDQVSEQAEETASVNRRMHLFGSLVYANQPSKPLTLPLGPGLGAPLCQTVVGRALLSVLPDKEIDKIIKHTNEWSKQTTAGFSYERASVFASIGQIRTLGYLYEEDLWRDGLAAIAVLVKSARHDNLPLVLAVAGATAKIRHKKRKLIALLQRYAGRSF